MSETPWLSIIGLGEDGPEGLSPASQKALEGAEIVMGPARHLALLGDTGIEQIEWPVPFSDGIEKLLALKGRQVAVLVSGDPFWFGAGSSITKHLERREWQSFPASSTFSLAANRLGWGLQETLCLGLHATPLEVLRPKLAKGLQAIVLLRDGMAVAELAGFLDKHGFGESQMTILEALGGPREHIREVTANDIPTDIQHPVCVALTVNGNGAVLPTSSGRPDDWFDNDGQITKRPIRAMTLSSLAPKPGEHLWDIGGGSGSIAIEWMLSHGNNSATVVEAREDRAARIKENAEKFGLSALKVVDAKAPEGLDALKAPDAVFIGGGLSEVLLQYLSTHLPGGTRIIANSVTLESDALLTEWQEKLGGDLMKLELSSLSKIGPRRGWKAAYPLVQWRVTL